MCHPQRELIFNGVHRALQPAGSAVPAFSRIKDLRFITLVRPGEYVSGTDLITVAAIDAFVVDQRGHRLTFSYGRGHSVIPALTRNPVFLDWIPAFAGMTTSESNLIC